MKKLVLLLGVLLSLGMFCACSSDEGEENYPEELLKNDQTSNNDNEEDVRDPDPDVSNALKNYCFDGEIVTGERFGGVVNIPDGEEIIVWLWDNPIKTLSSFSYCYIAFQKSDLLDPDKEYKDGDHVYFKIKKHGELYEDYKTGFWDTGMGPKISYHCVVEPC